MNVASGSVARSNRYYGTADGAALQQLIWVYLCGTAPNARAALIAFCAQHLDSTDPVFLVCYAAPKERLPPVVLEINSQRMTLGAAAKAILAADKDGRLDKPPPLLTLVSDTAGAAPRRSFDPHELLAEADALHALLAIQAEKLTHSRDAALAVQLMLVPEAINAELLPIRNALAAYEAKRWPKGKSPGGKSGAE